MFTEAEPLRAIEHYLNNKCKRVPKTVLTVAGYSAGRVGANIFPSCFQRSEIYHKHHLIHICQMERLAG